jgi:hypothetical protein
MKLTAELRTKIFAAHGIYVNEACEKCGKVLAALRWTWRGMPEAYCSQLCRVSPNQLSSSPAPIHFCNEN